MLFKIGGVKTKKNKEKEKREQKQFKPLINPNILKNKLLKRIKEHKQRETQGIDKNKGKDASKETDKNDNTFTDEFSDSMNYLQSLSKQKKKENLENKTVKHYKSLDGGTQLDVNLELPEELQLQEVSLPNETYQVKEDPIKIKAVDDVVPYGILKGGIKPTYRNWAKTQRNAVVSNPNSAITIEGGRAQREKTEREKRLQILREKMKNKKKEDPTVIPVQSISVCQDIPVTISMDNGTVVNPINNTNEKIIATKKITKTIIKKKYTLGKSKTKKMVGVLIKDRENRKNIISAQKSLKKKSINEINAYLRDHNLIKTGSGAPNDIKRKMYESAMLAGEVTNINTDTLLHNLSKVDKEL